MKVDKAEKEYARLRALFEGVDEKQLALIDGAIWEAARLRAELDRLQELAGQTGLIKVNPERPQMQKELPVSKMLVRTRANYLHYIAKLSGIIGRSLGEGEDDLSEYES